MHLREALKLFLPEGLFPSPIEADLDKYLAWDDWRVLGLLADGKGGEHGERLASRKHFRNVYHTPEVSTLADLEFLSKVKEALGDLIVAEESASKSWYKTGTPDIPVIRETKKIEPLSNLSSVLAGLKANNQVLLYSRPENAEEARRKIDEVLKQ